METSCPVCFDAYDLSAKQPRIWPTCGHTLCLVCLSDLIKDQNSSKCPLDNSEFTHSSNIERFPINYALKGIIETKVQTSNCPAHGEDLISYCMTDKCKICVVCWEEQHNGHQIRAFKTIKKQVADHRKQITELSDEIKKFHKKAEDLIDTKWKVQLDKINANHDEFMGILNYKKQCLIGQTNLFFYTEKSRIGGLLGRESALSKSLSAKELSLQSILEPEELLKEDGIVCEIQSLKDQFQQVVYSHSLMQNIEEESNQNEQIFEDLFKKEKEILLTRDVIIRKTNFDLLKVQSCFEVGRADNEALSLISTQDQTEIEIDLKKLAEKSSFSLSLSHDVSENDLSVLAFLLDNIKSLLSFKLNLYDRTLTKELYNIFCNNRHKLKDINIYIERFQIDENSFEIPFIQNIFLLNNNVEKVDLYFEGNNSLQRIFEKNIFDTSNLQIFSLMTNGEGWVRDEDMKHIFIEMPKLREYTIWLRNPTIDNKTLISLAKNTLKSASMIEKICLRLSETKITDVGVEHLCQNLSTLKLQHLEFIFEETQITDKSIEILSQMIFTDDCMKNLSNFHLDLSYTRVSSKNLTQLLRPLPNVSSFFLGLDGLQINDNTIQKLIQHSLVPGKTLKHLSLQLNDTKISKKGFAWLLENLNDSTSIELDFENTGITDKILEPFVDMKLSSKSICRELEIYVDETKISESLKQKIWDFDALKCRIDNS